MIYVAGSLFTEADIAQRLKEAAYLRSIYDGEVFNPIESPVNFKGDLPTSEGIYVEDIVKMNDALGFIFNFDNPLDAGVFFEYGVIHNRGNYPIVIVMSDIRIEHAGKYDGVRVPHGFNQMVIGAALYHGHKIFGNSKDAMDELVKMLKEDELRNVMPF